MRLGEFCHLGCVSFFGPLSRIHGRREIAVRELDEMASLASRQGHRHGKPYAFRKCLGFKLQAIERKHPFENALADGLHRLYIAPFGHDTIYYVRSPRVRMRKRKRVIESRNWSFSSRMRFDLSGITQRHNDQEPAMIRRYR
ncbi:uncharacterized protein EV420DRAFT_1479408 [Desarmillaria tabescens]|uniref:Uncharacterized protein n=1 Tax=Armillaria tabescens TaxID=1929756 RepID=A0AA39KF91_ARMTA|nr:uncharacterized protein EV420DRAFT_1479408 [Desarmillaria tabescens]KAK0458709.1 hypothetical protein EV420DRAFT_1479408 [Desarmillaria tabescens]